MTQDVLEVLDGPDRGARFAMLGERLGIGREPDMDAVMSDPRVSRRHAQLVLAGDALAIEDLGSTSGTAVNGVRVEGRVALRPGDRVLMGASELVVRWAPSRAPITEEGPVVGVAEAPPHPAAASTTVLPAGGPAAPPLPPGGALTPPLRRLLGLILAGIAGLFGVLTLVALGPAFVGGQGIAASGQGGLIAQTVLAGLALLGLAALCALSALGVLTRPPGLDDLLATGLLLVGGVLFGQAMTAATLSGSGKGGAIWLLLISGVFVIAAGAGAVALARWDRPSRGMGRPEGALAAGSAAGAILCLVAAPLAWFGAGFLEVDGFELGAGKALLAFAIIGLLAAPAPALLWYASRPGWAALALRAILPLGGVLLGFGLTICTVLSVGSLEVGAILALLGGLLSAGTLVAAVVVGDLRPPREPARG